MIRPRWRCERHDRLNDPNDPDLAGCGCPHPLDAAKLRDDADLQFFRAQRVLDQARMNGRQYYTPARHKNPGRSRIHDYPAIRAAVGRPVDIAAEFGLSKQQVYRIRRGASA